MPESNNPTLAGREAPTVEGLMHGGRPMTLRECMDAEEPAPIGYLEAFYEMAALIGIEGAQAKSPAQVYAEQIKPALEKLVADRVHFEDAYINMRAWAQQSGLDTTAVQEKRNG